MQEYIKTYIEYYDYAEGEFIPCEICGSSAIEIHHIKYKSQGGGNNIENLIAVCRSCHEKCHKKIFTEEYVQEQHNKRL